MSDLNPHLDAVSLTKRPYTPGEYHNGRRHRGHSYAADADYLEDRQGCPAVGSAYFQQLTADLRRQAERQVEGFV